MNTRIRNERGFTLYELLITLLLVGVVLALGVPNMADFTRNNRMAATANDFHAAFQLARSEAARAKENIMICASDNALDEDATCGGTWSDGFIVFVNPNMDLVRDPANEPLLRVSDGLATGIELAVVDDANYFMYAATGLGRDEIGGSDAVSQIFMCDKRGNETGSGGNSAMRLFVATPLGRATIVREKGPIGEALEEAEIDCPAGD